MKPSALDSQLSATPAAAADWAGVMSGLTGVRLAIYDDLIRFGVLSYERLSAAAKSRETVEAAVQWLEAHGFLVSESGMWRARSVRDAQAKWTSAQPAKPEAAVHAQFVSWF